MAETTNQGKLNFYKANGYFLGSINGNEGDLTGLGNDTSYYNNDLYVQWETKDGKVSDKVPLGTFITGHPASTTAQAATTTTTTTKATTTTTTTTKK